MRVRIGLLVAAGLGSPAAALAQPGLEPGLAAARPLAGEADAQPVAAVTARCQRVAAPGRVLCEVEAEVTAGKLAWADVVVLQTPDFAKPLRARVAVSEATTRTQRRVRLPVALVATHDGHGEVRFAARGVTCNAAGACAPFRHQVSAALHVGPDAPRKETSDGGRT